MYLMDMEDAEKMLTVPECAERLGVTQNAIRNAIHGNRLPSTSVYGRRIVKLADLEAYRQRSQPGGEKRVGRPRKADDPQQEG